MLRLTHAALIGLIAFAPIAAADLLPPDPVTDARTLICFTDNDFDISDLSAWALPDSRHTGILELERGDWVTAQAIDVAVLRDADSLGKLRETSICPYGVGQSRETGPTTWIQAAAPTTRTPEVGDFVGTSAIHFAEPFRPWASDPSGIPSWQKTPAASVVASFASETTLALTVP